MTLTPSKVNQGAAGTVPWPISIPAPPTITEKQDQPASTSATWTSATGANTAVTVATTGYGTATVSIQVPSTVTAGVITLEVSDDAGTTYYPAGAVRVDNGWQENVVTLALSPGVALNRMYAVSVDAMTQIRARLSTVITGSGNVLVRVGTVAGGIEPFVTQRSRKVPTYRANFRIAARPYQPNSVFAAAGRKQYATIHHAAASTKTVRIRHCWVTVIAVQTSAVTLNFELVRITTAPATGNPAITPTRASTADATAEATCLTLPTTAGTEEAQPYAFTQWDAGITGGVPTTRPAPAYPWEDLLTLSPGFDDESKSPEIRAGVLEGWAVTLDASIACTVYAMAVIEFTEEAP